MKIFYLTILLLAMAIQIFAQTPTKKWQGASSADWDYVSANWIPSVGLPFPGAFVSGDDVLIDDSKNEGKDTLNMVGKIKAANVTFKNSADKTPYYITASDDSSKVYGDGAIYKENTGEVFFGANNEMLGGVVVRDGYFTANDPSGAINAFGPKVTFEGGGIKIHKTPVDNPTYTSKFNIEVAEGKTGTINLSRRVNLTGKATGSGILNFISNGERDFIDLTNGADWSAFSGQLNIIAGEEVLPYTPGFKGLLLQTDTVYSFAIDDTIGTGTISEIGVNAMLANTKIHFGSGTTLATWSGNKCFQFGELSGEEDATIMGYCKTSTTPKIYYRVGSSNTNFTLASQITGQTIDKGAIKRYNSVGLIKVGKGTMRLTNPNNYITSTIIVKEGKLFVSNPEGSNTGTGYLIYADPLIVGPKGILGGTGSISRRVEVYGSLQPGEDAVGKLTIQDSLSVVGDTLQKMFTVSIKPVGELKMELASAGSYDVLKADSFVVGGTLSIIPAAVYDLKAGDSFKILEGAFAVESTTFDSISVPFEADGWAWDMSKLYVDGTISLTSGGGAGTYDPENPEDPTDPTDPVDTTGVSVKYFDENIKLFPNPGNGNFSIVLPQGNGTSIIIMDASGSIVHKQNINSIKANVAVEDKLSKGLYFVQINTTEGMVVRKIIVQ